MPSSALACRRMLTMLRVSAAKQSASSVSHVIRQHVMQYAETPSTGLLRAHSAWSCHAAATSSPQNSTLAYGATRSGRRGPNRHREHSAIAPVLIVFSTQTRAKMNRTCSLEENTIIRGILELSDDVAIENFYSYY